MKLNSPEEIAEHNATCDAAFGPTVKRARIALGIAEEPAAEAMGMYVYHLRRLEDRFEHPSDSDVAAMARAYNLDERELRALPGSIVATFGFRVPTEECPGCLSLECFCEPPDAKLEYQEA